MKNLLKVENLSKSYTRKGIAVPVLKDVSLSVGRGEFIALLGKSGSGKSSLLNILGLLDNLDEGNIYLDGQLLNFVSETKLARIRNRHIGFIFQSYNLLPFKTALENVALPLYYRGVKAALRKSKAEALLESVGMLERMHHYPVELSGGECQRVAIARAIIGSPDIILADEPTGALDSATGKDIMQLLTALNNQGTSIVMVTHDVGNAEYAGTIYKMADGKLYQ